MGELGVVVGGETGWDVMLVKKLNFFHTICFDYILSPPLTPPRFLPRPYPPQFLALTLFLQKNTVRKKK